MSNGPRPQILPDEYLGLAERSLIRRIRKVKEARDPALLILAHHYQRQDIVALSHFCGDSLGLARKAQREKRALWIVFCGVRFMAESAALLSAPGQRVIHPNDLAGCPLADMASLVDVEAAWSSLRSISGSGPNRVLPITYINSSAEIKAFCGREGGAVCTSSNAGGILDWALTTAAKVFFLPDQHLGRNTALARGLPAGSIILWRRGEPLGGNRPQEVEQARIILWDGHCHVHSEFTREQVEEARARYPGVRVIVHPECPEQVVETADAAGSTSFIVSYVEQAPPGSRIAVGTEIHLVSRLAEENPGKTVIPLARSLCPNMYRITLNNLCWAVERPEDFIPVQVPEGTRQEALLALNRMLSLG